MARLAGPLVGVAATALLVGGGPASAEPSAKAGATVISMEQDGKELFFEGPASVEAGTTLKIKNSTNPRKIGPHTFSLVNPNPLPDPDDKDELRKCGQKFKGICGAIAEWHEIDFQAEEIGRNPVEAGKEGWNRKGSLKRVGDSWFTITKNEAHKREVTAGAGNTLQYFCAIHPEMQGEIEVD